MRPTPILPVLAALTAAVPAQWVQANPNQSPSLRRAGAMAFDGATNRLLLYGGVSPTPSTILAETWSFNGQWQQLAQAAGLPRWGHQMVRNPNTNRVLTFGGRSPTISGLANDTYEWTGSTWVAVPTPTAPSPRFLYGMAYDQNRTVFVLFGGRTLAGANAETWEFDGLSWTQRTTANAPAPREEFVMFYDTSLNRTVLFGGCDEGTNTVFGDTWFYDGIDWTNVTPTQSPSPRFRCAYAFDSVRRRGVVYGGFDGTQIRTETFEFTGDQWLEISTGSLVPPNATEAYAGFDPVRRRFVVFGGFGGTFSNATWEYQGATGGVFGTFGDPCATSAGVPTIASSTPTIGQTLQFTVDNAPASAEGVLFVLGLSNLTWLGVPLPFPLGIVGLSGCDLLVSADVIEIALTSGGSATFGLPIPNQTSLISQSIFVQGIVADLLPGFTLLGATRGGRALLGN